MSKTSESPFPYQPGQLPLGAEPAPSRVSIVIAACSVLVGCVIVGLIGGLIWSAVAPRPAYVIVSRGTANVVNAETSAFITGDAWYCLIGAIGGLLIGIASYQLAVRKYGPAPMAAVLAGGVLAGLVARWVGQDLGLARFNAQLMTSKHGTILHAPPVLGVNSSAIMWPAVVFWPLAACLIPAALVFFATLRDRPSGRRTQLP